MKRTQEAVQMQMDRATLQEYEKLQLKSLAIGNDLNETQGHHNCCY